MWTSTKQGEIELQALLQEFTDLIQDTKTLEWFENVASGAITTLPLDVASRVNRAIGISNKITSIAGISSIDLLRHIRSGTHLFGTPAFKSNDLDIEAAYTKGVMALQQGDYYTAIQLLNEATSGGHVSAYYNLSLLHGSGLISPYNLDLAADYFYKAAAAGHPKAKESLWLLEAADRGGFGADNLASYAAKWPSNGGLNYLLMICGGRFYDVLCRQYGATADVIAYELDAASTSDDPTVLAFLQRTGVDRSFYEGGLDRLIEGSAADQITDGLNNLHFGLKRAGTSDAICRMVRCTIVGYVLSKSPYGANAKPLLGIDQFFN